MDCPHKTGFIFFQDSYGIYNLNCPLEKASAIRPRYVKRTMIHTYRTTMYISGHNTKHTYANTPIYNYIEMLYIFAMIHLQYLSFLNGDQKTVDVDILWSITSNC